MNNFLKIAAVASALIAGAANAVDVTASGSGWIQPDNVSNSFGFGDGIHNHYAGFAGQAYNNYFEFLVPNAVATSASLNIYNAFQNTTIDAAAEYSVHGASSFTFSGLADGPSFGSVTLGVADTGVSHYVSITLNSLGLAFINSHLGQTIQFGGTTATTVDPTSCFDCVAIFGYTGGTPAAVLTLNAVPEPATWALMIVGFGLVGTTLRRRAAVAA